MIKAVSNRNILFKNCYFGENGLFTNCGVKWPPPPIQLGLSKIDFFQNDITEGELKKNEA